MKLQSTSLIRLEGADRQTRLSYVFEDDSGCRKGLTVTRLLPGAAPTSYDASRLIPERPAVYVGGTKVGIFDPHISDWDAWQRGAHESEEPRILCGAALTCTFSILNEIETDSFATKQIVDPSDGKLDAAHVAGEGPIGTVLDTTGHIRWGNRSIYPLLRVQRSKQDVDKGNSRSRNGALVTNFSGALIGVIVAMSADRQCYAVAPIRDIMEWHRLHLADFLVPIPDPMPAKNPRPREAAELRLSSRVDPRLKELAET